MDFLNTKTDIKTNVLAAARPYRHGLMEIIIFLLASGLFFWYVLQPKQAAVKEHKATYEETASEHAAIAAKMEKMSELVATLRTRREDAVKLDEALPLQPDISTLYVLLESYAKSSGLAVGGISVGAPDGAIVAGNKTVLEDPFGVVRKLKVVTANISLTGDFQQFEAFLEKIETYPRVLDISSLDITATDGGEVDFKFSLTTHYYE